MSASGAHTHGRKGGITAGGISVLALIVLGTAKHKAIGHAVGEIELIAGLVTGVAVLSVVTLMVLFARAVRREEARLAALRAEKAMQWRTKALERREQRTAAGSTLQIAAPQEIHYHFHGADGVEAGRQALGR